MNKKFLRVALLLFFISAVSYLPLIGQIGYLNDDWYLMYTAKAYGPGAFVDIFSVDRPARALVMIPAYKIFGDNPLYYNLSAYIFYLVSTFAFLWILRMLFPDQNRVTLLGSILYLTYPGFLSHQNGIDYQSQMVSLAAAMLSVAFSIKFLLIERGWKRHGLIILSTLTGWLYLGLVEYFIGFELFRWGSILLLSWRREGSSFQKVKRAIYWVYPTLVIPVIFLIWRIFFFQSERGATDVTLQLNQLWLYPLQTVYHWSIQVISDFFDVTFVAWILPLAQLKSFIQPWGVALAVLVIIAVAFMSAPLENAEKAESRNSFAREALLLGLFITIGGLIPIAMVNREVSFPAYSRYSLVSAVGVALVFMGVFVLLRNHILQGLFVVPLLAISILTHHANFFKSSYQTALTRDFWWQVSWRVPQFERNTTLIAYYPGVVLEEDYFIWGPANLIYYPGKQNEEYIQPGVYAALLNSDTIEKVHNRERQEYDKRKNIITYANFRNILILTQPSINSCVHALNGVHPEYSSGESSFILEVGAYSEIEHVLEHETPHIPPTVVFGPEPEHDWCYYYEKAALARQREDWDEVLSVGEQAFGQGLKPKDPIEWMPFLQAYAFSGDVDRLVELAPNATSDLYISRQTCQILSSMENISSDVSEIISSLYCLE